jgi:LacI family transcriptional regulator
MKEKKPSQSNSSNDTDPQNCGIPQSCTIGLIITTGIKFFVSHYFTEMLQDMAENAGTSGCDFMVKIADPNDQKTSYVELYDTKKCDGLLLVAPFIDDPKMKEVEKKDMPAVIINGFSQKISYVDSDNIDGVKQAIAHFTSIGHKRIAIINGMLDSIDGKNRFEGYKLALEENKIAFNKELVTNGNFAQEGGYGAMKHLLKLKERPTAIFAANDMMAIGAIQALKEEGLRVPQDMSIIGFDDLPLSEQIEPPLTTVKQPITQIGKEAVALLITQIQKRKRAYTKLLLKPELKIRKSTQQLKA